MVSIVTKFTKKEHYREHYEAQSAALLDEAASPQHTLDAVADGREAFRATVSAMVDMGREVPAPAFNVDDFTPVAASGKVLARMPRSMHLQLAARAKTEGVVCLTTQPVELRPGNVGKTRQEPAYNLRKVL